MTMQLTSEVTVDAVIVRTADEWAEVIKSDLTQAVEGIVSAGRNLIAAKADVGHTRWLPMLRTIGISQQWASRLMSIATNPAISNHHSGGDLPTAVNALYELSRLDPEVIEEGIANGDISPSTTTRDAREFARRDDPAPRPIAMPTPPPIYGQASRRELSARAQIAELYQVADRAIHKFGQITMDEEDIARARYCLDDLIMKIDAIKGVLDEQDRARGERCL